METEGLAASKKNAARLGAHLVFADESGFLLIPNVVKTWAPRGQTPVLRHYYRRERISVISGVSPLAPNDNILASITSFGSTTLGKRRCASSSAICFGTCAAR